MRQVKWWSVIMVSRYDVKSSTWSSHFWVKMHVFPTSFRNGRNKSLWIKWCKVIIYVLFYMLSAKKLLILTVLTWSLILDKIQDGGGDGDHVRWRHRSPAAPPPIKYTWFCGENQRISTEGKKSFRNTATDQKPCGGRGAISLPPPPLVPRLGYDFACMSEGQVRLPKLVKHDLGIFLNNRFSPFSFSPLW